MGRSSRPEAAHLLLLSDLPFPEGALLGLSATPDYVRMVLLYQYHNNHGVAWL